MPAATDAQMVEKVKEAISKGVSREDVDQMMGSGTYDSVFSDSNVEQNPVVLAQTDAEVSVQFPDLGGSGESTSFEPLNSGYSDILNPDRLSYLYASISSTGDKEDFNSKYEDVLNYIQTADAETVRLEAAKAKAAIDYHELETAYSEGMDPETLLLKTTEFLEQQQEEEDKFALEKLAVDRLKEFAESNPEWKKLQLHHQPVLNELADQAKKDSVIAAYMEDYTERRGSSENAFIEFFDDSFEILLEVFGDGFVSAIRRNDMSFVADNLQARAEEIRAMDPKDIPMAMDQLVASIERTSSIIGVDNEDSVRALQLAFGLDEDLNFDTAMTVIEGALFLPVIKSVGSAKGLLKSTGNSTRLADDAAEEIQGTARTSNAYKGDKEDAVKDLVAFKNLDADDVDLTLSAKVLSSLKENDLALRAAKDFVDTPRLKPEEYEAAFKAQKLKEEKMLGRPAEIAGVPKFYPSTGTYEMEVMIGKLDGSGYATKKSAKRALSQMPVSGTVTEIKGQGFYIKYRTTVSESLQDSGLQEIPKSSTWKRFVQAPRSFVDRHVGSIGTAANYNEARLAGTVKDIYNKNIGSLDQKSFKEVSRIWNLGLEKEQWFSPSTLDNLFRREFNKPISDSQIKAYYAGKQIEDFGHFVQNRAIYQEKAAKGMKELKLTFVDEPFNGTVYVDKDDILRNSVSKRIYVSDTNEFITGSLNSVDELVEKGYRVIRPENADWTAKSFGEPASLIAVRNQKDIKINKLSFNQLPYAAGGRRKYSDKFFIGQTRSGKFNDGSRYVLSPRVYRSASTRKGAEEWVSLHNSANKILVDHRAGKLTDEEADALLDDSMAMGLRDYEDLVEANGWDITKEFKIKFDKEDFPADPDSLAAVKMYDPTSLEVHFGSPKGNRFSSRGERLKNIDEDEAPILDFVQALNETADQAIRFGVYNDFRISAINRFNTEFSKYIKDFEKMTPYEVATKGVINEDLARKGTETYNQIKGHQFYINSILRQRTEWDEAIRRTMHKLAEFAEGKSDKTAKWLYDQSSPVDKIKSLNYDLNLGFFNPAQLFMQANSVLTAISLSPVHGLKAAKDIPLLRYALIANNKEVSRHIEKSALGVSEMAEGELVRSVEQLRRMGMVDFGSNLAMMDVQSGIGAISNPIMSKVAKIREHGRFFFQEGERYGRLTAYGIAKRKYADKFPGKDPLSKDADFWIREEADRLLLSPNSDNNQWFTKGAGAIPTQFWSYMFKMSDALLTGSGKRYSLDERAKLLGGQVLFYGSAGAPLLDHIVNNLEKETGTVYDPMYYKMAHNGMIDSMLYAVSGGELDTDFSASSGIGGFWSSMYKNIAENPVSTLVAGPTGANVVGAVDMMTETARIYNIIDNPTPEGISATALAGVSSLVKSMSKVSKGYLAYNTGIWYDKHGRAVGEVTKSEAIASVVGLKPQMESDAYEMIAQSKAAKEEYIQDVVTAYQRLHNKWIDAETPEEKEFVLETMNAFSTISKQTGYWQEAASRYRSYSKNSDIYSSQVERLSKQYFKNQEGVNYNYLPPELKEQILKIKEEE